MDYDSRFEFTALVQWLNIELNASHLHLNFPLQPILNIIEKLIKIFYNCDHRLIRNIQLVHQYQDLCQFYAKSNHIYHTHLCNGVKKGYEICVEKLKKLNSTRNELCNLGCWAIRKSFKHAFYNEESSLQLTTRTLADYFQIFEKDYDELFENSNIAKIFTIDSYQYILNKKLSESILEYLDALDDPNIYLPELSYDVIFIY